MKTETEITKTLQDRVRGLILVIKVDDEVYKVKITNGIYIFEKTIIYTDDEWEYNLLKEYQDFVTNMFFKQGISHCSTVEQSVTITNQTKKE